MPSSTLTGNWRALEAWTQKLGKLGSNQFAQGLSTQLADKLLTLVDTGFKNATDPDDHPWAPKAVPDGKSPLHGPTGQLSQKNNWLKKQVDSHRIRIGPKPSIAKVARFAQFGTGKYGPKGRAFSIFPKTRKALTFLTRGGMRITRANALNPGSPIRRILPSEGRLPYRWFRSLSSTAHKYMRDSLKKAV